MTAQTSAGRAPRAARSRRSDRALSAAGVLLGIAFLLAVHARVARSRGELDAEVGAAIVRRFGLTDLALFTEARYTRHPSQADRFAPFGEHPHALEHFPSGSIVEPTR